MNIRENHLERQWDTSGENTLDVVADRLVRYDLLDEQPDTSNLLVGG